MSVLDASKLTERDRSLSSLYSLCDFLIDTSTPPMIINIFVPKEKKSSSFCYCFDDDVVLRYSKNLVGMLLILAIIHID